MKITQLKILKDGDVVDKVEENKVYIRTADSSYCVYTFHLDESDSIIDYDVLMVKRGNGTVKISLDADLNELKDIRQEE